MFSTSPKVLKTRQTSFGKMLRIYRERANPRLTQTKLGELVEVSDKTIRNWEDDLSLPTVRHLKKLVQVFQEQTLFTPNYEQAEAIKLWQQRQELDKNNLFPDFDTVWFQQLQPSLGQPLENTTQNSQSKNKVEPLPGFRLPAPLTSLVGRERELAQLTAILRGNRTRLLTLTGIGGVGKTRLALELAHSVAGAGEFRDGVCFVPLAAIYDPEILGTTVAQALNLKIAGGEAQLEILLTYLRHKQLLLILDNFEQLLAEGAVLIHNLLEQLPGLKCVITSRQLLNVTGEYDFQVAPLPVCLWSATEAWRQQSGLPAALFEIQAYRTAIADVKTRLNQEIFDQLWQKGQTLSPAQLTDFALLAA